MEDFSHVIYQIFKKHWIKNIFLLIGLFLLFSFFLPFTAEGSDLNIDDEYCSGSGEEVTFKITIHDAPEQANLFKFKVKYDADILEYQKEKDGSLHVSVSVTEYTDYLQIKGNGNIDKGESGRLVSLTFIVKECEKSTLELTNLSNDFVGWNHTSRGHLRIEGESGGSSYSNWPILSFPGSLYQGFGTLGGLYPIYAWTSFLGSNISVPSFQGLGLPGYSFSNFLGSFNSEYPSYSIPGFNAVNSMPEYDFSNLSFPFFWSFNSEYPW